jgi:V8-like Glu-specific endopeptidase
MSVGRILKPGGFGTGFLVRPDVLLTNNHVLPDAATAGASKIEMNYQQDGKGGYLASVRYALDAQVFRTNKALDYSLVGIKRGDGPPLSQWGQLTLNPNADPVPSEHVVIIQHPSGAHKQIVLTANYVIAAKPPVLRYTTDTMPGSSGSPVFNDSWQVVAIHQALGRLGHEESVFARVSETLRDRRASVRAAACQVLGSFGGRAIPALLVALSDRSGDVRADAARALSMLGHSVRDPRLNGALLKALRDRSTPVRAEAAVGLGVLREPQAFDPLVSLLRSGRRNLQVAAARALADLGDPRALGALTRLQGQLHRTTSPLLFSARAHVIAAVGEAISRLKLEGSAAEMPPPVAPDWFTDK